METSGRYRGIRIACVAWQRSLFPGQTVVSRWLLLIQLMEPGAVHVVDGLLIKVLHKGRIIVCVLSLSRHMVQAGACADRLGQRPVHPVVHHRLSVPVRCVHNAGCAVCVPAVRDLSPVELLCRFQERLCLLQHLPGIGTEGVLGFPFHFRFCSHSSISENPHYSAVVRIVK